MVTWDDIDARTFWPSHVHALTGVTPDQQRQWSKRYDFDYRDVYEKGNNRPFWSWVAVQQLACFATIFADLKDADRAKGLVDTAGDCFNIDQRHPVDGDVLLTFEFGGSGHYTGAGNAAGLDYGYRLPNTAYRPGNVYSFNFSAMQRRLYVKLIGEAE